MWTWLLLGWLGLALLGGAIYARWRSERRRVPKRAEAFLEALHNAVASVGDGVSLGGIVPGRFTGVFVVDGQETPVPLQPLRGHWEAFPHDLPQIVKRLVGEIREDGLDRTNDFDFGELATDILPQIRSVSWIEENSPAFGDGRLVYRPLGPDLAVCYVIDDSWSMVFVCEGHLRQWRRAEEELFGLARRNLAERTDAETGNRIHRGDPIVVRSADGYAAARLLLLDVDQADDILVALPDRDVLWIGEAGDADLGDLMARNAEENAQASRPVSSTLYRVSDGVLTGCE